MQIIAAAKFPAHFMFDDSWVLTTERLALRPARAADFRFVVDVWTDAQVRRFLGGPISGEDAARRIWLRIDAAELVVVFIQNSGQPIGVLCISDSDGRQLELSYLFLPEYWNHGYAIEATAALVRWLASSFADGSLVAITQAANVPSRNLLLRLGFQEASRHIEFDALQITYVLQLCHVV